MDIILLGSGNVATVLARLFVARGHRIVQVWSRNTGRAAELAQKLGAETIHSLKQVTTAADICLLAVTDDAIAPVAAQLKLKKKILVHTAGSVSINVLKDASPNYGVLYPLQSLRREIHILPVIPFLVDGNTDEVKIFLYDFAMHLSEHAAIVNDTQRKHMHLSAVMVSNFTNHLYTLAEEYCLQHQLNFELLYPLITEVANRLSYGRAKDMQTGPARRGDDATIQKHLGLLNEYPALQQLYRFFSSSIQKMYT